MVGCLPLSGSGFGVSRLGVVIPLKLLPLLQLHYAFLFRSLFIYAPNHLGVNPGSPDSTRWWAFPPCPSVELAGVMIHPNYFSPHLDHHHPWAPSSYQCHQYPSLPSHYPSSLWPRQGCLCKWTQSMFHYRLRQREPQMTNYGYPQMPPPSTSCHSSSIRNLLDNSTTVKLSEESPSAQSAARYASPSQPCSTYPFPLMLILDPPPLWTPSVKANHITTSHVAHPRNPVFPWPDHGRQKLKNPTAALLKEGKLQTIRTCRIRNTSPCNGATSQQQTNWSIQQSTKRGELDTTPLAKHRPWIHRRKVVTSHPNSKTSLKKTSLQEKTSLSHQKQYPPWWALSLDHSPLMGHNSLYR